MPVTRPEFDEAENSVHERINKLMQIKGTQPVDVLHRKFGLLLWDTVGMARNKKGLEKAIKDFSSLKAEFWSDSTDTGWRR